MNAAPRCVVVDDDADFLVLAERFLRLACPPYEVMTFSNSVEAVEFLWHSRADVVVTDYRMPVLDGFQLIGAIRTLDLAVPIVLMSDDPVAREAVVHGANAFVPKSAMRTELIPALERLGVAAAT